MSLGDKQPTTLLYKLQALSDPALHKTILFKAHFLALLPADIQTTLSKHKNLNIETLAQMADKTVDNKIREQHLEPPKKHNKDEPLDVKEEPALNETISRLQQMDIDKGQLQEPETCISTDILELNDEEEEELWKDIIKTIEQEEKQLRESCPDASLRTLNNKEAGVWKQRKTLKARRRLQKSRKQT